MNVLDPRGPIGAANATILIDSIAKAHYMPRWAHSGRIEMVVWSIPTLTIILLGGVAWLGAHHLDPAKPIEGSPEPLTIQAVSLDWKWLFIYPDQKVATINTLTVPAGVPLQFQLTSASVMNAFFIPQFGSMIYTMNGMATRLNLRADTPGTFQGLSAHFSGDGFSDMHFDVHVVPSEQFSKWAQDASGAEKALDQRSYDEIARPSMKSEQAIYRLGDPNLFNSIVMQKLPPSQGMQAGVKGASLPAGVADAR